jgi:hypothetical protein
MKKFALAAALLLTGCQAPALSITVAPTKPLTTKANATGAVRVALAGLATTAAYKTLATRSDVARLRATLTSHQVNKSQVREIGLKELAKPQAYIDFDAVAAGKATLFVEAFNAGGRAIGRGENATAIVGGTLNTLHVRVKLDADDGEGKVNAIVTFEDAPDGEPYPADGEAAFRRADRDADGWVSLAEYRTGWPHAWGGIAYAEPDAIGYADPGVTGDAERDAGGYTGSDTTTYPAPGFPGCAIKMPVEPQLARIAATETVASIPAVDPRYLDATRDFECRDQNGDQRLSLEEFLGFPIYTDWPMPIPMRAELPGGMPAGNQE